MTSARQITITGYLTSNSIELNKFLRFFNLNSTDEEFVFLSPHQLSQVMMGSSGQTAAWLCKYGSICLTGFDATETRQFLRFMESMGCPVDHYLFSTYTDSQTVAEQQKEETVFTWEYIGVHAIAMAKSLALKKLEDEVSSILDQSEHLILDLQTKAPNPKNKLIKSISLQIIEIQFNVLGKIKLLDRPCSFAATGELKQLYASLVEFYELKKRFTTLQKKMDDLISIISPYQRLGHDYRENRLLVLEVILLALFPLFHMLQRIIAVF